MRRLARQHPDLLNADARTLVEETIRDHCEHKGWQLAAANARSNHVHAVIACDPQTSPEDAMAQLKSWCTRRLREAGYIGAETKPWTQHGSTRWINDSESLAAAIDYVMNHQDTPRSRDGKRA